MKTKTSILILAIIAAIILAVVFITKAKDKNNALDESMMTPTAQQQQSTNGMDAGTQQDTSVIVEPAAPANPEFPVTGFEPAQ